MEENILISLQNISKSFDRRAILENVSFDIERNKITAIIGKSGVGKSVLVKHIIGLIKPDSGDIIFDGFSYSKINKKKFSEIKSRCSYMFQNNALFDSLTVFENIALPLREKFSLKNTVIAEKVSARISQLDLVGVAHMYPKQISGGMQKRVALARALVTEPEVIFFDEPTTGLDPIRKNSVFSLVYQYHKRFNFTAVIITHDIPDVFYIAHCVHILDEGNVIFSGTPIDLERSRDPRLYLYTHGHELLVDELTGFHDKFFLSRKYAEFQSKIGVSPCYLVAVHLAGLRVLVDCKGSIFVHSFVKSMADFVCKSRDDKIYAGFFSMELCVVFLDGFTAEQTKNFHASLCDFFAGQNVQDFLLSNKIQLNFGLAEIEYEYDVCSAIKKAFSTLTQ